MALLPDLPRTQVAGFCRRHHVRRLALFGSVLQEELSALVGRPVDLNTPDSLSRYFRDEVVAQAQPIYEGTG